MEVTHNLKRKYQQDPSLPLSAIRVIRDIPYFTSVNDPTPHRHLLDIYYLPPTGGSQQEDRNGKVAHNTEDDQQAEANSKIANDNQTNDKQAHGVRTISQAAAQNGQPRSSNEKVPIIIHFNGGGWVRGSKDSEWRGAPPVGRAAARHGLVAVCANYRLAPLSTGSIVLRALLFSLLLWLLPPVHYLVNYLVGTSSTFLVLFACFFTILYSFYFIAPTRKRYVVHPQMMEDPVGVVDWVIKHINEYVEAADTSQMFLSGHSAGAHLVSLLATDHTYNGDVAHGRRDLS